MRRVDHTYRDFSRYLRDGGSIAKRKKSGANFPARLHQLLSDPQFSDAIAWMPHGRAWRIVSKKRLMSEAVPLHFSMTKFESFARQLSGWGFKRLHRTGADLGGYYHECFLRGIPELTAMMPRVPLNCGRPTPSPEDEPNFDQISQWYPLPPYPGTVANDSDASSSGAQFLHPIPPAQELHVASSTYSSTVTDQAARTYPVQITSASARPTLSSAGANAASPLSTNIHHSPIQSKMQSDRQHDGDLFSTTQQGRQDDEYDLALFDGTNPFT